MIEQYGRIGTEEEVNPGDNHTETVSTLVAYTSQTSFMSFVIGGKGIASGEKDVGGIGILNTSNSSVKITGGRTYYPWKWLTKGY